MLEFQKWLGWIDLGGLLKKDEASSQKREEKDAEGMWREELLWPIGGKFLRASVASLLQCAYLEIAQEI